jgi:hypothetical protein
VKIGANDTASDRLVEGRVEVGPGSGWARAQIIQVWVRCLDATFALLAAQIGGSVSVLPDFFPSLRVML